MTVWLATAEQLAREWYDATELERLKSLPPEDQIGWQLTPWLALPESSRQMLIGIARRVLDDGRLVKAEPPPPAPPPAPWTRDADDEDDGEDPSNPVADAILELAGKVGRVADSLERMAGPRKITHVVHRRDGGEQVDSVHEEHTSPAAAPSREDVDAVAEGFGVPKELLPDPDIEDAAKVLSDAGRLTSTRTVRLTFTAATPTIADSDTAGDAERTPEGDRAAVRDLVRSYRTDASLPGDRKDPDGCRLVDLFARFASAAETEELRARMWAGGMSWREVKELALQALPEDVPPDVVRGILHPPRRPAGPPGWAAFAQVRETRDGGCEA